MMRDAIAFALADQTVRVVVIASAISEYFSAGADLREFERMKARDMRQGGTAMGHRTHATFPEGRGTNEAALSSCERTPIEKRGLSIDSLNAMCVTCRRIVST